MTNLIKPFFLLILFFFTSLNAGELDTDTFEFDEDGWSNSTFYNSQLLINRNNKAEKTYTFSSNKNETIHISLEATEVSSWELNDLLEIYINGSKEFSKNINGTEKINLETTLDANGEITIGIKPKTNNNAEKIYINNIVLDNYEIVSNANDICYSDINGGCQFFIMACQTSIPIHNISDTNLSDAKIYIDTSGFGSFMSSCSIGDGANGDNCENYNNYSFGPASMFPQGTNYNLEDSLLYESNISVNQSAMFDMTAITSIYATYIKNDKKYIGEISKCNNEFDSNNSEYSVSVDVVDDIINDTYEGAIKTKISNKSGYTLKAYYLGDDNNNLNATNTFNGDNNSADLTILYNLSDETCTQTIPLYTYPGSNNRVKSIIEPGDSYALSDQFTMAYNLNNSADISKNLAKKVVRVKYKTLDFNSLILDSNIQCVNRSSITGGVKGLPQCITSNSKSSQPAQRYIELFGQDTFDRCWNNNGEPCLSSNGGVGNSPYDHEYGCFECTLEAFPYSCSTDAFAIRPNNFELSSTSVNSPDLMLSGNEYNLSISAYNHSSVTTQSDYNQTKSNMEVNESKKLLIDGTESVLMHGNVNWGSNNFNIANGVSNNGVAVSFNDVGKVTLIVKDKNWAAVDINNPNDLTSKDCSSDGAYICGEKDLRFIPHHFGFKDTNLSNNGGPTSKFTYIANLSNGDASTYDMAARVQATIVAQNKSNQTTQNFDSNDSLYENPISINFIVNETDHGDANTTSLSTAKLGGFTKGEKVISWNESNSSQVLRFNFKREVNNSLNPFYVNASDINISANSTYTGTAAASPVDISGNKNALDNGSTTFVYGRTYIPRQTYDIDSDTPPFRANIYYEAYCFSKDSLNVVCDKSFITPLNATLERSSDLRWYINKEHTSANGNAGVVTEIDSPANVTGSATTGGTIQDFTNLTYSGSEYPYITTMENNASGWLIQNESKADATTNSFQVEFIKTEGWSGKHETETTTKDDKINKKTPRRIMW